MSFKPKRSNGYVGLPNDDYRLVCAGPIDLGAQQSKFGIHEKLLLNCEAVDHPLQFTDKQGNRHTAPRMIGIFVTNTTNLGGNLAKYVAAFLGKSKLSQEEMEAFELPSIIGKGVLATLVQNSKGREEVVAMKPLSGPAPKLTAPEVVFQISEWNQKVFESLPKGIQKLINSRVPETTQGGESGGESAGDEELNDSIPF